MSKQNIVNETNSTTGCSRVRLTSAKIHKKKINQKYPLYES